MTIDENTVVREEDQNGNWKKRKITPEEIEKFNSAFRFVNFDLARQLANEIKSWQIQNPVFDLLDQIQRRDEALLQASKLLFNSISTYYRELDIVAADLQKMLQFQLSMRQVYYESLENIFNLDSYIQQNIKTITQTLITFKANILGITFDFRYQEKQTIETKRLIVELDNGTKTENGIIEYSSFEMDGIKYRLQAVPENQGKNRSLKAFTGIILDSDDKVFSVEANTHALENIEFNEKLVFKYDSQTATIIVGPFSRNISPYSFVHRSLVEITRNKTSMKKFWFYSDLIETQDPEELHIPNIVKNSKDKFLHIKRRLPPEIKDLFIVKSKYVQINPKYIK